MAPARMADAAPGAEFQFIAHLPQHGLEWSIADGAWGGRLPSVVPDPGGTVWGAVFTVPDREFPSLDAVECAEGRAVASAEAMDRNGKRHNVTMHVGSIADNGNGRHQPSAEYVALMVDGSRHWSLPFGWIAGLEEHLAPRP